MLPRSPRREPARGSGGGGNRETVVSLAASGRDFWSSVSVGSSGAGPGVEVHAVSAGMQRLGRREVALRREMCDDPPALYIPLLLDSGCPACEKQSRGTGEAQFKGGQVVRGEPVAVSAASKHATVPDRLWPRPGLPGSVVHRQRARAPVSARLALRTRWKQIPGPGPRGQ
jgi:hypothetical protein